MKQTYFGIATRESKRRKGSAARWTNDMRKLAGSGPMWPSPDAEK